MLGKFLVKDHKDEPSALNKNQIEVVCPVCGASQREPKLVVTTFCKKCGEHLRMDKQRAVASSQCNPNPSAVFPAIMDAPPSSPAQGQWEDPDSPEAVDTPSKAAQPSLRSLLGLDAVVPVTDTPFLPELAPALEPEPEPPVRQQPLPVTRRTSSLARTDRAERPKPTAEVQGPIAPSTFQKMKDQGYYRQQYFKEVECLLCHNKFKVGRAAKSATCPTCSCEICMEDFDINIPRYAPIDTLGDVMVRKNGVVDTSEIRCRDLRVNQGKVSATIVCSGDITIKSVCTIEGDIHCHRIVVEKGSEITVAGSIFAEQVEIEGHITSTIHCQGKVLLRADACVQGDVSARSVSIEPGGELDGSMNILRSPVAPPLDSDSNTLL